MKIETLYKQWCKETKRGGAVLVGGSIREFFEWLERDYKLVKSEIENSEYKKDSEPQIHTIGG